MLSVHSSPIGRLGTMDTGGMSVSIREIARHLGEMGHHVDIFTRLSDPMDEQVMALSENVRLIHLRAGDPTYISKMEIYPLLSDLFYELDCFVKVLSFVLPFIQKPYQKNVTDPFIEEGAQ